MKQLIIKLNDCGNCPYFEWLVKGGLEGFCDCESDIKGDLRKNPFVIGRGGEENREKAIKIKDGIPIWCPLEEYKQTQEPKNFYKVEKENIT